MVVAWHDGHLVESKGENPSTVKISLNDYGQVVLTVKTRHGAQQAFLSPDDALDVALYLMRERRLGVRGRG